MSLACDVKAALAQAEANGICLEALKAGLLGTELVSIAVLCEKIDALEELICPEGGEPLVCTDEDDGGKMVLPDDRTASFTAGSTFTIYDDTGKESGQAEVTSATYDAATNKTTVEYTNSTATVQAVAVKKSVTTVKEEVPTRG